MKLALLGRIRSRSRIHIFLYRSEDPDPHKNKMDPKPCLKILLLVLLYIVYSRNWVIPCEICHFLEKFEATLCDFSEMLCAH